MGCLFYLPDLNLIMTNEPVHELAAVLKKNQSSFHPVVPFDPGRERLTLLDFTENNRELTDDILGDNQLFSRYIDQQLASHQAVYGIGGYAEHRTIYSRSSLFDGGNTAAEPRRLHLGTDIWGPAGTPVMAPLAGRVHSFAWNGQPGDYGTTIILVHQLDDIEFYTLYGHLSLASIQDLWEGDAIAAGKVFAWFGEPAENGQWPSHLHFQLIRGMQGHKGDYPGVCRFSERKACLDNCPDPDLVLQLNRYIAC